jgi:hypothetical protein
MPLDDAARQKGREAKQRAREDPAGWLTEKLAPWGVRPLGPGPGEVCAACVYATAHACWPWISGTRDDPLFSHCSGCHRTWRTENAVGHCNGCHEHFASDDAFDDHRVARRCRDPRRRGMVADGLSVWSLPRGGRLMAEAGDAS